MPQGTQSRISADSSTDGTTTSGSTGTTASTYPNPTYPISGIFVQEGAVQSKTNFSLPINFNDTFMVRGDVLSTYLRTIPNTTKFCLVGKFNYISGTDKFLLLSAKPKLYTDLVKKTTEYYLQVEPANSEANQNDCLVYNLTNALFNGASNPTASFSLSQVCANCSNAITSTGLRLFFINGQEVPTLTTSALVMTISGSSTSGTASSCTSSSACVAGGFSCCLQGQCVKDGATKPGASAMSGFDSAAEDVQSNPARYILYPQFYFVCDASTGTPGTTPGGTADPDYEAQVRIMETGQLYDCINKKVGEFSLCTVKVTDASAMIPGIFSAADFGYKDDINFSTVNSNLGAAAFSNNIYKIRYAGQTLYEQGVTALFGGTFVSGTSNDNLTSSQSVSITAPVPTNAPDDNLYITYKVDGTCQKVGSTIARCMKSYIQDSSDTTSTMYHNASRTFILPSYADVSPTSNIIVKIGGIIIPEDTTTWSKAQSPNRIIFNSGYAIYQNQTVEITYYVSGSSVAALTGMKTAAQDAVNRRCGGSTVTGNWNLTPKLEGTTLVDYDCVPPATVTDDPPANQTVLVSGKNTPHRYFDVSGVSYDSDYSTAPDQELLPFSYTDGNVTKPNNVSAFVGFNEIYGSFAKTSATAAKPAKLVRVKKDRSYDILVTTGSFATCTTCGSDYYNSLQKIFPQNFAGRGGGYSPDLYESRRESSTSPYRSDDLLYGRACFVPATMIPWTHKLGTTTASQRQSRLASQHFLFANGYNRDWYGFDYGSLIGSFDGVTWFSIGNQRRIKASTNKLFIAVNAYFGDLTVDNTFSVNVSETTTFSTSTVPDHDTESDGAECQKAHFCSNDNDCYRTFGYDYSCQNIAGLSTNWPVFDANGAETIGTAPKTLVTLLGGTNGQSKRCVYRGRGAPCVADLTNLSTAFNGSSLIGTVACSANNYCQSLTSGTTTRFNDRIARFATTPTAQNAATAASTVSDIVGLGARILGRPFDYYGTKSIPSAATAGLSANQVSAVCIPGKSISTSTTTYDLNQRSPSSRNDSSDKIIGAGVTSSSSQSTTYYNACTATDNAGVNIQLYPLNLGDAAIQQVTINQNLSTNLLDLAPLTSLKIFSTTSGSQTTAVGYQKNACLRAPGASCFSDLDCGPSAFAAAKAKSADLSSLLVSAEEKFWEEEMVCGNPDFKYVSSGTLNPNYDIKKNVCCRESGNVLTTFTQMQGDVTSPLWCNTATKQTVVAGVNTPINTKRRYSKVHVGFDKMTCDPDAVTTTKAFALSVDSTSSVDRLKQILAQYKTLDTVNSRACCTTHWVRSFASTNGGGHAFARTKMQTVDKTMFKHVSWAPQNTTIFTDAAFECDPGNYTNSSCEVKSLTSAEQDKYLTWAGSLELIGIPQVAVMANDQVFKLVDDNQLNYVSALEPLDNSIVDYRDPVNGGEDFDDAGKKYYSAASYNKFDLTTLKKVFSENEFNCCIPTGQQLPDTTTGSQCCTGFAATSGVKRCCLPDYTDVTVYLNRYVSSEGRGLAETAYDKKTGYIKDPAQVQSLVVSKNLCCSGKAMTGVAISQLSIPLTGNTYPLPATLTSTTKRLNYRTDDVDNNAETGSVGSFFDAGVRWNNHVYCVP